MPILVCDLSISHVAADCDVSMTKSNKEVCVRSAIRIMFFTDNTNSSDTSLLMHMSLSNNRIHYSARRLYRMVRVGWTAGQQFLPPMVCLRPANLRECDSSRFRCVVELAGCWVLLMRCSFIEICRCGIRVTSKILQHRISHSCVRACSVNTATFGCLHVVCTVILYVLSVHVFASARTKKRNFN